MTYLPFAGKNAIVTGASRGIGRGIALKLAERGARVVVADVNLEAAQETAEVCGNGSFAIALDVSNADAVRQTVADLIQKLEKVDILVNNAGINRDAMLHKMTDAEWDSVLAVDLSGVFYMCREVGTHMRTNQYGRIVNVASASWMGNIGQTNYAAAKGGVVSLTRSISKELAFKNVTANAICPGFILTEMTKAIPEKIFNQQLERIPLGRAGEPEDVANLVAFLASDDASYLTGEVINIGGGYKL
ncbi:3-oxoacyl-[acyl-carrier-protein] reductase [Corynebacterium deserti GIMN1.010]|uniref:3-oxoacyl-[acyl-carrier-protein] reductase n=1 Tax=Corynebacterium deserti GIMN1.010 TaxID=931089 RepID=A0A0M3QAD5_9CORY|nr:3-oxoacyl-ACP reductase FabG [Corynebacterium deserti]ALC07113.1 3-oxoacyl-[acyl-carrier-protein] reductase [Corynebacterium deserti GIMN1.010]